MFVATLRPLPLRPLPGCTFVATTSMGRFAPGTTRQTKEKASHVGQGMAEKRSRQASTIVYVLKDIASRLEIEQRTVMTDLDFAH